MREKKDIRIFFALWPDEELRKQLQQTAELMTVTRPGRRVPLYNLHLTLHFIGNVSFDEMACLQHQARQLRADGFEFAIDCRGYFKKPRVAWLGCSEIPPTVSVLQQKLGRRLQKCDYQPEKRRFNPHVTVARKINHSPEIHEFAPLLWRVDNFVLIESRATDNGVIYKVIESYPLT